MVDAVLYPDAVKIAQTILAAALTVTVTGERVPDPRPASFVRIIRSGGVRANIVADDATLLVESWAQDEGAAHALAQLARQALHSATGTVVAGTPIYRVDEFSGPGTLPDPVSGQPRATQTFSVTVRGT